MAFHPTERLHLGAEAEVWKGECVRSTCGAETKSTAFLATP